MSDGPRKQNQSDPTAERTAEQSTQTAGGLGGGRGTPETPPEREGEDVLNRSREERYDTPRRYEEGHADPTMPSDDSTLNTKI